MSKFITELLSMSIESSFLIAAVVLFRIIFKKSPKKSRLFLWALVGTRLLIPFSFKTSFSAVPSQTENLSAVSGAAVKTTVVPQSPGFEGIAFRIWLVGFSAMTAYFILSTAFVYFKVADGTKLEKNVFQSEKINSPFVLGFIKPRIFIPYGCDEKTLGYVLNHEKEHIKTFDCITRPLSFIILCVHWFNPFVWAAYLMFDRDIELACDERVLKKLEKKERVSYAEALLNVGIKKKNLAVAPVAFGEFALKERIKSAANYKKPSMWVSAFSVALCLVFTLLFMTERQPVNSFNEAKTAVKVENREKTVNKQTVNDTAKETQNRNTETENKTEKEIKKSDTQQVEVKKESYTEPEKQNFYEPVPETTAPNSENNLKPAQEGSDKTPDNEENFNYEEEFTVIEGLDVAEYFNILNEEKESREWDLYNFELTSVPGLVPVSDF